MNTRLSRRSFLKKASAASAAAALTPTILSLMPGPAKADPSTLNKWPGRVVLNYNNLHASTVTGGTSSDKTTVKKMVDDSIKLLTGLTDVGAAWKSIFPTTLSASSKIALKINILTNDTVPPHPFLVMGITEGLEKMDFGGTLFPAANITIYDGNSSGDFDNRGFTAARFPGITRVKGAIGTAGGARDKDYSDVLAANDFLINVPGIRGHSVDYGSATLGFKSHFGTYDVNGHADCDAYLRDINCTGPVFDKTVLTVFCAIYANTLGNGPTGGPYSYLTYAKTKDPATAKTATNTMLMSTDPVTAEYQAYKIMKTQAGQTSKVSDMPLYLQASGGVAGSLSTVYNIGTLDPGSMDVREIINEVIVPVTLSSFTAEVKGAAVVLAWTTESELDNYGWNIQRSTLLQGPFTAINQSIIPGFGTTGVPHAYSFTDANAGQETCYYRLEQIDLDQTRHYSEIIAVQMNSAALTDLRPSSPQLFNISIPNPAVSGRVSITFTVPAAQKMDLSLYDNTGKMVYARINRAYPLGMHRMAIDHPLAAGTYVIRLKGTAGTALKKLVIAR